MDVDSSHQHKSFRPLTWLRHLLAVRQKRKDLALLEEHELADLGLNKPMALGDARKVWDVPLFWLKSRPRPEPYSAVTQETGGTCLEK